MVQDTGGYNTSMSVHGRKVFLIVISVKPFDMLPPELRRLGDRFRRSREFISALNMVD